MVKRQKIGAVFVGAGAVWSGVGTLVVARVPAQVVAHLALPKEEPRHPLWSPARPWVAPCRITPSLLPSAGDHKGPHSAPHLSRPYGYRRHLSASSPLCCFHLLSLMHIG